MRLSVTIVIVAAMFLTSCAYQGTIVEKHSRPHPLYHSVGIEGVYTFVLRDQAGALHRQMVTPEVFEQYGEGDYFNDLQPGASRASDFKATRTADAAPVKRSMRTASAGRTSTATKSKRVAAKPNSKRTAAKTTAAVAKRTPARTAQSKTPTRQAQRSTRKSTATKVAAKKRSANQRRVAKRAAKPWKTTDSTVETAPATASANADPAPPAEGPAPLADTSAAPGLPPAAKPSPSPEADIVYIPPPPR